MESLEFSVSNMSSADNHSFTSSFPIWMPFAFSYLIALAKSSKSMLHKSGKSEHPCLIPDLRQEALNFSLLSVIHAVGLSYVGFIVLRHVPYVLILLRVFTLSLKKILQTRFQDMEQEHRRGKEGTAVSSLKRQQCGLCDDYGFGGETDQGSITEC